MFYLVPQKFITLLSFFLILLHIFSKVDWNILIFYSYGGVLEYNSEYSVVKKNA